MKAMNLRQFLRGGYKTVDETTVVTSHGRPIATWIPHSEKELMRVVIDKTQKTSSR